jgi:Cu2+-exporting ATPase
MIDLVEQAQQSKSRSQDLASRAALWLTIIALTCGGITLVIWLAFMGRDFAFSLERTVTVMVITCPQALGLAVPLVVAVCTALSAKNGLLIRNRAAFERGRNIGAIIFDKTGTLTQGRFGVTDTLRFSDDYSQEDLIGFAAAVESQSEHPIAQAIADAVEMPQKAENFKSITGKGAQAQVAGKNVKVVSPGYLRENDLSVNDNRIDELNAQGKTVWCGATPWMPWPYWTCPGRLIGRCCRTWHGPRAITPLPYHWQAVFFITGAFFSHRP